MKKKLIAVVLASAYLLSPAALAAQTYEGTSLPDGIFYLPEDPGPGSVINFSISELLPDSEIRFILIDGNQNEIDGLEVAGAVVLRTDAAGNFNGGLRLPSNLVAGTVILRVEATRADLSEYSSELAIVINGSAVSSPGGTDTQPESLAFTGTEPRTRVFGAVLLVGIGTALILVASKRRPKTADA